MKNSIFVSLLVVLFLAAACAQTPAGFEGVTLQELTPEATAASPTAAAVLSVDASKVDCFFATIQPASTTRELLHLSGTENGEQKITLETDSAVRISWDQSSAKAFELDVIDLDPAKANDPGKKQVIESFIGPSAGCSDIKLLQGDYQITIAATGEWDLLIQEIEYIK